MIISHIWTHLIAYPFTQIMKTCLLAVLQSYGKKKATPQIFSEKVLVGKVQFFWSFLSQKYVNFCLLSKQNRFFCKEKTPQKKLDLCLWREVLKGPHFSWVFIILPSNKVFCWFSQNCQSFQKVEFFVIFLRILHYQLHSPPILAVFACSGPF